MSHRTPVAAAWAAAAGLIVLAGVAGAARGGSGGGGSGGSGGADQGIKPLTIAGEVEGLYPGGAVTLPLRITNPNASDLVVRSVGVEVVEPGSGCPAAAIVVDDAAAGSLLPRRGSATVAVTLRMQATAPDSCQGATFPLRYTVTATKAR